MSSFEVTVEQVQIFPHPNADRLELAQVGLYRAVVLKDQFKNGDYALYIPEAAVLPDDLIEELGLTGRLAGKQKNRVSAVRLRGELSQGIVCRPKLVEQAMNSEWNWGGPVLKAPTGGDDQATFQDFAELLGITKYVPPIPVHMAGKVFAPDRLMKWVDIESIKRFPTLFQEGDEVSVTEKVHGTCFMMTFDADKPSGEHTVVSSKGYGAQGLAIEYSAENLYWRAVQAYDLELFADKVSLVAGAPVVALFGEVYGLGVQDLGYGADAGRGAPGFALFDIAVDYGDGRQVFLNPTEFRIVFNSVLEQMPGTSYKVQSVPVLYEGPYDEKKLLALAEGKAQLGGDHVREGVVVRPAKETYSPVTGGRKIGKIVGGGYLTRGGDATEYE